MSGSITANNVAKAYVEALQRDGRLLLRYVARKIDRLLAGPGLGTGPSYVLTADPDTVASTPAQFAALAACVDDLSRRASPATVTTIRITSAYLRVAVEGGEPPEEVLKQVRRLRSWMSLVALIAVVITVTSVLLLAHVDDGRRAVQQLERERTELARIRADLEKLPEDEWVVVRASSNADIHADAEVGSFVDFCRPCLRVIGGVQQKASDPWKAPRTPRTAALCRELHEILLREDFVFVRLTAWNCLTYRIPRPWLWTQPHACSEPIAYLPGTVHPDWWQRTEIRSAASMSVLSGFVLPLLLGCIGGCAYALRRLDQKLSEWTLEARDGLHSALRILLATMLGGLLGLVWSGDQPVQLGGYALSLAAAAFFVGFSLEIVFTVIESMVDGVAGKLRAPANAPVTVPVAVPGPPAYPESPIERREAPGRELPSTSGSG